MMEKRTSALHRTLERILPPNVPADTMHGIIVGSLAIGALAAAIDFTARYSTAYRSLFGWNGWLSDTALMSSFSAYAEPVVIVFGVVVLLALLSAVMLYSSYYLGGRSIYLMRRLPDGRQTLRRQVWTAPLLWAVSTVVLCALGGLVGIALGFVASIGLAALIDVPFAFDPVINLVSFLFAAGMGIVFGYYPASRASKLDPIDALRHE